MKKLLLLIAAMAVVCLACNDNSPSTLNAERKDSSSTAASDKEFKETRNRKIVMESIEAFNRHDVDAVFKDADPNSIDYGDGRMPPVKGIDSAKAGVKAWLAAVPDVKGEDFKVVADGDIVIVWGKWTGTWKNDFMGQKATGKPYRIYDADIFKMSEDGKVLEHHSIQSSRAVAFQIGMKMH